MKKGIPYIRTAGMHYGAHASLVFSLLLSALAPLKAQTPTPGTLPGGVAPAAGTPASLSPAPSPVPGLPPGQTPGGGKKKKDEGVRLKDLARISGIRSNQLLGYGIVVGLPGTGDTRSRLAADSMKNLLGGLGTRLDEKSLNARNIAAVLVTCEIPAFAKKGDRLNVIVSSIGDARSLEGGVLIQTPLYAGNNTIYGVAQGVVATGGESPGASSGPGGQKTVGQVMNGAIVERETDSNLLESQRIRVSLNNFDFSTLDEAKNKIQTLLPDLNAKLDGTSILVDVPTGKNPVEVIASIENIRVTPSYRARVVINERTGTIVMGGDIRVDPVAVSRGGMQLIVTGQAPDPARMGIYLKDKNKDEKKKGQAGQLMQEVSATSVQEIIESLNALGADVKDTIAILEALKESGALHAELVVQ